MPSLRTGDIVIALADGPIAEVFATSGDIRAWYLGGDWRRRTSIEDCWDGRTTFSPIADYSNKIAWRIADQIINIDAQIVPIAQRLWWLASDMGDRGPYVSSLLEKSSWYIAFFEVLAGGGDHVFVVEDADLARLLYGEGTKRGHRMGWNGVGLRRPLSDVIGAKTARLLRRVRLLASRVFKTAQSLIRLFHVRHLRRRYPVPIQDLKGADVILVAWTEPGTLSPDARIEMGYGMGDLPAVLRRSGLSVGILAMPIDWLHDYRALTKEAVSAADPVLLLEDCVDAEAIVRAAIGTCRLRSRIVPSAVIDGQDISGILDLALEEELTRWRPARSKLYESIGAALRRMGIVPRAIIFPHEGQPWEKCLTRGSHAHLATTRMVAYQCAPFAPLHISFFPSAQDIALGEAPDRILVSGSEYADRFLQRGYPSDRLYYGGALRRTEIHRDDAMNSVARTSHITAVCSCSISVVESLELIGKSVAAVSGLTSVRLVVNFHPLTLPVDRETTRKWIASLPGYDLERVIFSDASFSEIAADCDVVLCDRTGVVFEAMARGIAVINIGADSMLELHKVHGDIPLYRTTQDIRHALQTYRDQKGDELAAIVLRYMGEVHPAKIVSALS